MEKRACTYKHLAKFKSRLIANSKFLSMMHSAIQTAVSCYGNLQTTVIRYKSYRTAWQLHALFSSGVYKPLLNAS